jgi:uncharacterized repeat protein (TIGR04138 family)
MDTIRRAARDDGRYSVEAYHFLLSGLDQAVEITGRSEAENLDRHVSGQQLVEALRVLALDTYGPLAKEVWNSWGVTVTRDWGESVVVLINLELFSRQESDTVEDFDRVFDFESGLLEAWTPQLPLEDELFGKGGNGG